MIQPPQFESQSSPDNNNNNNNNLSSSSSSVMNSISLTDGYVGTGAMDNDLNNGERPLASSPPPSDNTNNNTNNRPLWEKILFCFTVETYKCYFDVDTVDVQDRVKAVLTQFHKEGGFQTVLQRNGSGADMYGPWWITTTLVFFVAVTSNLSMYLHSDSSSDFEYDINHLVHAMTVLYSFVFLLPVLLFFALQCLGIRIPLLDLTCYYGYSLVPFVPASIICSVPHEYVIWPALLLAFTMSLVFLLKNIVRPIMDSDTTRQKEGPVFGSVIGFHVIFLLTLKFYFYHHHKKS